MSCYGGGEVYDDDDMESNGTCPDCGCETFDGVSVCPACSYSPVICKTWLISHVTSLVKRLL